MKTLTDARTAAIKQVADAKAMPEGSDKKTAMNAALDAQTRAGEEFGEDVARQATQDEFPNDKYDVTPLTPAKPAGGPRIDARGTFDQVYEVTPKDGGPSRIIINEAKGPNGSIGTRDIGNQRFQQGTRGYLEDVLRGLRTKDGKLYATITQALADGRLEYRMIRAQVDSTGAFRGYSVTRFDLH